MGVFIDYDLMAECTEEELVSRLERVRQRCLDLPLKSVGKIRRLDPVYNPINLTMFQIEGHTLPAKIQRRFDVAERKPDHGQLCLSFGLLPPSNHPESWQRRYFAPALELIERTNLWKSKDLPDRLGTPGPWGFVTYSVTRAGIQLEFANVLLRYGYLLLLDPGDGSESVSLGLSTYAHMEGSRLTEPLLWHGSSFTRTQYAKDFIRVHETVCQALDIVKEEGLLFSASDTCGYYADREWKEAGRQVNEEMSFAKAVSDVIGVGIGDLREEGVSIQVVVDNASKAKPIDFSSRTAPDAAKPANDGPDTNSA